MRGRKHRKRRRSENLNMDEENVKRKMGK